MRMQCLIINGVDRGLCLVLRQAPPIIRVAVRPKDLFVRTGEMPPVPEVQEREYRLCFRSLDGEVHLYSEQGSSLDILAERDVLMPDLRRVNARRAPIAMEFPDFVRIEQPIEQP